MASYNDLLQKQQSRRDIVTVKKERKASVIALSGEYDLETNVATTWCNLIEPRVLQACIKGCDEVRLVAEGHYEARFSFGFGPLKKSIVAELHVEEIAPPEKYALKAALETRRLGNAGGTASVSLQPVNTGCKLHYQANVTVSGWFDSFGDSFVTAAADRTLGVFFSRFAAISKEFDAHHAEPQI